MILVFAKPFANVKTINYYYFVLVVNDVSLSIYVTPLDPSIREQYTEVSNHSE